MFTCVHCRHKSGKRTENFKREKCTENAMKFYLSSLLDQSIAVYLSVEGVKNKNDSCEGGLIKSSTR